MYSLALVGIGVAEASDLAGLTAEETVKLWSNLVSLAFTECVALGAARLYSPISLHISLYTLFSPIII